MKYLIVSISLLLSIGCSHKQLAFVDIKNGDTLSELAVKYKISQKKLRSLNPNIRNPDLIFRGKKLVLRKKQEDLVSEDKKQWKCNFKLEIISKEGVSLSDFNDSLDKFVSDWIDVIPDTGTAAPESAIDFWHGGLHFPPDNKEQNLGKQTNE